MKKVLLFFCLAFGGFAALSAQNNAPSAQTQPSFPQSLVTHILQEARPVLQPIIGLNLGQMIQAYRNGGIQIEYLCRCVTDSAKGVYLVSAGGTGVIIVIADGI